MHSIMSFFAVIAGEMMLDSISLVGFGRLFWIGCSVEMGGGGVVQSLGGLQGGGAPLSPDSNRQAKLLRSRIASILSFNWEILSAGILGASMWLLVLTQFLKQCPWMCQWGHSFAFLFQVIHCLTSLFPKVPAHVSPSFTLNSGQGDSFMMNLLSCFFLLFLLPSFLAATAAPAAFAASVSFCSFGAGGLVNDDGRFNAKVPKWMPLMSWQQSRMLSLILFLWVAVMQSSSQSWKQVSTAYINLQQNFVSVRTWALNDCLDCSTSWTMEVMAWWGMQYLPKKIEMRLRKPSNCCIISM
jgi:hypothetical protein